MNFKKCKSCGQKVPEGNFCDQCGALMTGGSSAQASEPGTDLQPDAVTSEPAMPVSGKVEQEEVITDTGSYVATIVRLKQIQGGNARLTLKPDTVIGRVDGPYKDILGSMRYISSRHAMVTHDGKDWWIEDLKSTNGTYVNDDRLTPGVPHKFASGDVVDLGSMIFEVL